MRTRLYHCVFHLGEHGTTQEFIFSSCSRKGSKRNTEDAYSAIRKKYGVRARETAVIDAIWRCTEDDF